HSKIMKQYSPLLLPSPLWVLTSMDPRTSTRCTMPAALQHHHLFLPPTTALPSTHPPSIADSSVPHLHLHHHIPPSNHTQTPIVAFLTIHISSIQVRVLQKIALPPPD